MSDATAIRRFYGRWARLYDVVATRTPLVGGGRERAVAALDPDPGDTVVDFGCGTGANFRPLRARVGDAGRVLGVDVTGPMLVRARERASRWDNVAVCRGDASRLPVDGGVDGVLAAFLVGLLSDPADAVERWLDLADGGRVALLDAVPSPHLAAAPLNLAFGAGVWLGAPDRTATGDPPVERLVRAVDAAHGVLEGSPDATTERTALGFLRITAATSP